MFLGKIGKKSTQIGADSAASNHSAINGKFHATTIHGKGDSIQHFYRLELDNSLGGHISDESKKKCTLLRISEGCMCQFRDGKKA